MNLRLEAGIYEKYEVKRHKLYDGIGYIFRFPNNYGASVVKHHGSYGSYAELWELAVIEFAPDSEEWHITYDTDITSDVEGYLSDFNVRELLGKIKDL